ncbi:MAG: putative metal-binding motif-containing protein, partial [Nanoarchaeota archaeon]
MRKFVPFLMQKKSKPLHLVSGRCFATSFFLAQKLRRQKKFLILFFISILLLVSIVLAADIAYVVGDSLNPSLSERSVEDLLNEDGHNLIILDREEGFNADDYDLVIVSDSVADIGNVFDHRYHKTLFLSNNAAEKEGFGSSLGQTSGVIVNIKRIDYITQDFSLGSLTVYPIIGKIKYLSGCLPINGKALISKISSSSRIILLALDKDSLLLEDGACTERIKQIFERNLYFGITDAEKWNENSIQLFRKSISWLLEQEDNDGDGYYINLDCNDDNPNIHPGADE